MFGESKYKIPSMRAEMDKLARNEEIEKKINIIKQQIEDIRVRDPQFTHISSIKYTQALEDDLKAMEAKKAEPA